jgi:hypothetical protein
MQPGRKFAQSPEWKHLKCKVPKAPKVPKATLKCHPEAQPNDLANEKEILPLRLRSGLKAFFAQNDSFAVTLGTLVHFSSLLFCGLLWACRLPNRAERYSFRAAHLRELQTICLRGVEDSAIGDNGPDTFPRIHTGAGRHYFVALGSIDNVHVRAQQVRFGQSESGTGVPHIEA